MKYKTYTNEQWQEDFKKMKANINKSNLKFMSTVSDTSSNLNQSYKGKTQYQYYCSFINDILRNIRKGKPDYCFYKYQVSDLLRFEYDNLEAVWLNDEKCFRVSLKISNNNL